MAVVRLGNPDPLHPDADPGVVTEATVPDSKSLADAVADIVANDGPSVGVWVSHSRAAAPSWVESDDPELEAALAAHFGCPAGRPA